MVYFFRIIFEAIIVAISIVILGYLLNNIFKFMNKMFYSSKAECWREMAAIGAPSETAAECGKQLPTLFVTLGAEHPISVYILIFLSGFLIHIIYDLIGFNRYYCKICAGCK